MNQTTPVTETDTRAVTDAILTTEGLTKRFGALTANHKISLSVERGDIHGIIGPNGSGKSTFFNTVTKYHTPDEGSVYFNGTDITELSPDQIARQGLIRTFQIVSPFQNLTVRENLHSVYTPEDGRFRLSQKKREKAEEVLDTLDIAHVADHDASDISGGQQKLLELGRALMLEPDCLMLDEPTAGVNPALENKILDNLKMLNKEQGITFLIIEHDMAVISGICNTVSVFNEGEVMLNGDFETVASDDRVQDAYLGEETNPDATYEETIAGSGRERSTASRDSENEARLVAKNIESGYGEHKVINDVSIESRDGITCIFGPNGSGKSTLIKTLSGHVPAWSGEITYNGTDITSEKPENIVRNGVVSLPQNAGVFPNLSVRENLLLGGYTAGSKDVINQRLEEVRETFPALDEKLGTKAKSLSGGQQMMLSFGRCMMTGANVFLLDEPSSGLAPSLVDQAFHQIERLVDQGNEVILIEQNVRDALKIADYIYILVQGELEFEGAPGDLADEDEIIDIYLGMA